MEALREAISSSLPLAWLSLLAAFAVLAKCADLFVESAVGLANRFKIPRLVIGILLVSLATTAPELTVSLMSAIRGMPEMALGNAVGSVICDDGLALGMCGLFAVGAVTLVPAVFNTAAIFLIIVDALAFVFVFRDFTLDRWEGAVLLAMFFGYVAFLFHQHRKGVLEEQADQEEVSITKSESLLRLGALFAIALAGILVASEFIVTSASTIAEKQLHVPKAVIALTLVAFGTSVPEVATCIAAARKKEGAIAVGNILGADIMNICWVAGASAIANPLVLGQKEIFFMFPAMFIVVGLMLLMLRYGYCLTRKKGIILLVSYAIYIAALVVMFPPTAGASEGAADLETGQTAGGQNEHP